MRRKVLFPSVGSLDQVKSLLKSASGGPPKTFAYSSCPPESPSSGSYANLRLKAEKLVKEHASMKTDLELANTKVKKLNDHIRSLAAHLAELDRQSVNFLEKLDKLNSLYEACFQLVNQERDLSAKLSQRRYDQLRHRFFNLTSERDALQLVNQELTDSLQRSQPVHARAVQNRSREMSLTGGMKDKALEKRTCPGVSRKPSELSCQEMQPKVYQSENQRPNYMLPNTARNRLIRNTEAECGRKYCGKERKEKEGGEGINNTCRRGINNTCRRDPKSSNNPASTLQKKLKPVHKGKEEISTICRRDSKPVSTAPSIVEKNSKPFYKTAESWSGGLKHTLKGTKV